MVAVDTNILVYAHRSGCEFYDVAAACMVWLAEGAQAWGIPVSWLHEFLAVVTHPKVFAPASTTDQALAQIGAWLASSQASAMHSGQRQVAVLSELSRKAKLKGRQFHAARIAAIWLENAVAVLWLVDHDFFGRFKR